MKYIKHLNMIDIETLDEQFGIEGELGFLEQDGELVFISVYNKHAEAEICLYGGHVTRYTPHGTFEVLWLSSESLFEIGKPIRGGIPVCFPWFGPHASDQHLPLHGFARLLYWEVVETSTLPGGETHIVLKLESSDTTRSYWPHDFIAMLEITVGRQLEVNLTIENCGKETFSYTTALHSYFNVSEIENISIGGLQNSSFCQGANPELQVQEEEMLVIRNEENRRYIGTTSDCNIYDPVFMRTINVEKKGSEDTVVWNPWMETCAKVPDLADDDYQTFVCVEAANIMNHAISLNPGEKHLTGITIDVEQLKAKLGGNSDDGGFRVV